MLTFLKVVQFFEIVNFFKIVHLISFFKFLYILNIYFYNCVLFLNKAVIFKTLYTIFQIMEHLYYKSANLCLSVVCLCAIQSNSFYPIITKFGTRVDWPKRVLIEKKWCWSVHYCVHRVDFSAFSGVFIVVMDMLALLDAVLQL